MHSVHADRRLHPSGLPSSPLPGDGLRATSIDLSASSSLVAGQKMFPLFRRRDGCKKLYIVRHGESTCNAAMAARGSGWADPQIFDAQLTDKGRQQVGSRKRGAGPAAGQGMSRRRHDGQRLFLSSAAFCLCASNRLGTSLRLFWP